jgi:hypothetical protein
MEEKPYLYRRGTLLETCRKPWVDTIPCAKTRSTRNHGTILKYLQQNPKMEGHSYKIVRI